MNDPRTEEEKKQGIPLITERAPYPSDPNPIISVCGKCGLRVYRVMDYVCPHAVCPCEFSGLTCHTNNFYHREGTFVSETAHENQQSVT